MKVNDIVELEIQGYPYFRTGRIINKRYKTYKVLIKYDNGRDRVLIREEKQLKLIKENKNGTTGN